MVAGARFSDIEGPNSVDRANMFCWAGPWVGGRKSRGTHLRLQTQLQMGLSRRQGSRVRLSEGITG